MNTFEFQNVAYKERKQLSQSRNINLQQLPDDGQFSSNRNDFTLTTPIGRTLRGFNRRSTDTLESKQDVKFRIYLTRLEGDIMPPNIDSGVDLTIESGNKADSEALLNYLSEVYELDVEVFSEMFALWMVSPLLEVQLKTYHRPYEIRQQWMSLLEKFGEKNPLKQQQDEPILMLRRNVYMTNEREFEILEQFDQYAPFLVTDAREMLALGKIHFTDFENVIKACALIFRIQYGPFDVNLHDFGFIRSHIEDILPDRYSEQITGKTLFGKVINKKTAHLEKFIDFWKNECEFENEKHSLEIKFLKILTENSSCYGAAWFNAEIEKQTSKVSIRNFGQGFADIKANVGINDQWITIIDSQTEEVLFVHRLDEIHWELDTSVEHKEPFLLLNVNTDISPSSSGPSSPGMSTTVDVENNETVYFLMIFGSQTILIDALLKALTGKHLARTISDSSASSGSTTSSGRHESLIQSRITPKNCSTLKDRKLCLAKFQNGICTEVAGSFKNVFALRQSYE